MPQFWTAVVCVALAGLRRVAAAADVAEAHPRRLRGTPPPAPSGSSSSSWDDDDDDSRYDLVIFTAAIGPAYASIATDWCRSVETHVAGKLPFATKVVVLTDAASAAHIAAPCEAHVLQELNDLKTLEPKQRALRIKTLKMMALPFASRAYMWLDVDVRPVKQRVASFRRTLREIVASQATDRPVLRDRTIALTRTRRDTKYNGGLFLYADPYCVDLWKQYIHHGYNATGRDQPALLKVATDHCDVVHLPDDTQGYFTVRHMVDAFIPGLRDRAYDHALMHYTGSTHDNEFWFRWAQARGVY
mmetsp:Transcript_15745/g.63415  ORF Transcript_15745/g.63415 Transcript_15745/m.63415 type:complete len:302 (-) Transcript_15745:929-1834(-)